MERKLKEDSKDQVFFSHGKTNSCGVLTAHFGKENFFVGKQETDKEDRILTLNFSISMIRNTSWLIYITVTLKESKYIY